MCCHSAGLTLQQRRLARFSLSSSKPTVRCTHCWFSRCSTHRLASSLRILDGMTPYPMPQRPACRALVVDSISKPELPMSTAIYIHEACVHVHTQKPSLRHLMAMAIFTITPLDYTPHHSWPTCSPIRLELIMSTFGSFASARNPVLLSSFFTALTRRTLTYGFRMYSSQRLLAWRRREVCSL